MSLAYHPDEVPTVARCEACDGSGDEWQPCGPDGAWEPVGECGACHGTGVRPGLVVPWLAGARGVQS